MLVAVDYFHHLVAVVRQVLVVDFILLDQSQYFHLGAALFVLEVEDTFELGQILLAY